LSILELNPRGVRTRLSKDVASAPTIDAFSQAGGPLVSDIEEFLAVQLAKNRARKTLINYRQTLFPWAAFCVGRGVVSIDKYKLADHAVFLTAMQNRGLKGTTIDLTNTMLRVFTKWAAREGKVKRDPLEDFDRTASEKPLPKALPWELVEAHILQVKSRYATVVLRDRFLIRLISYTGMRPNECLKLRRLDLDLQRRQFRLENTKGGEATWQPYPEKLHPYLEQWIAESHRVWPAAEWLFPSRTGKKLRLREVQAAFKSYGIATPHVYRHTYGTYLLEQGANIVEVKEMLRHKNIQTTVKYLKIFDSRRRSLANLIK
jgi:integrase/recombinase XerD